MSFLKSLLSGSNKKQEKPQTRQTTVTSDPKPAVSKPTSAASFVLKPEWVHAQKNLTNKDDVLSYIAAEMKNSGFVSQDYLPALRAREEKVSTFLINGVAIPHGTVDQKHLVTKTGIIVVQIPQGVLWNENGDVVKLAVGIAANGNEHMAILQSLTNVVMDESLAKHLGEKANAYEIVGALTQTEQKSAQIASDLEIKQVAVVADAAGIHARPASKISEIAAEYPDATIQLRNADRSANAKSMAAILAMGATMGDELVVSAKGSNAEAAVAQLAEAISQGLDEEHGQDNANYNPLEGLGAVSNPKARHIGKGSAASPGIAVAQGFALIETSQEIVRKADNAEAELSKVKAAIETAKVQLDEVFVKLEKKAPNEAAIIKAQKQLMGDESIITAVKKFIAEKNSAAWSWNEAFKLQIEELNSLDDERIRARVADMQDVSSRVVAILQNNGGGIEYPTEDFVLVAKDLTPSQTAQLDEVPVKAIVTELGGPNSHMAILARALGIPAVVGIGEGELEQVKSSELIIVDPQSSSAIFGPDAATVQQAKDLQKAWSEIQELENSQKFEPAETTDGRHIEVVCNIASPKDSQSIVDNGGEGAGLLRTEFLFESSSVEPTVKEQTDALVEILSVIGTRQLVVRTADIGGDKPVSWLDMPHEENPFLGVRGIRLSFKHEAMFRHQLEAIYRAAMWQIAKEGKTGIHIMFPMIAKMSEWRRAQKIAHEVRDLIKAPNVPMGIMIEVPSAALIAESLAAEVDFFSVGSNDLTQYTLAMDRLHPDLSSESDSYHPALLRLISLTVKGASKHGKWVGVCGNMAADPNLAALLVGLGVTELSVSPVNVPAVKHIIRSVSYEKLRAKAQKALGLESSEKVMADRKSVV